MIFHLKYIIMVALFYLMRIFPIKRNKIVFCSFSGKGFGDNCKYIALELLKQSQKYDLVWLTANGQDESVPSQIRTVKYLSLRSVYEQATAKVWIDNRRKPGYVRKRRNQYYIQTWHGMSALKKVEKDALNAMPATYTKAAMADSQMADLFLAPSRWDARLYRDSFWYNGEILKSGIPRMDILFKYSREKVDEIRNSLGIPNSTHIVLYVPTFRKDQSIDDLKCYMLDWAALLSALSQRFGGEWKGIIRLHPNISKYANDLEIPESVINATNYPDIQELMLVSDCAISDYSSSLIEFSATGKPGFIFAVDRKEYDLDRGSYFKLDELPFPIAESMGQLGQNICDYDEEEYRKLHSIFYNQVIGIYKGGSASLEIAEKIERICTEGK